MVIPLRSEMTHGSFCRGGSFKSWNCPGNVGVNLGQTSFSRRPFRVPAVDDLINLAGKGAVTIKIESLLYPHHFPYYRMNYFKCVYVVVEHFV